jgi:hypothetical protein
MGYLDKSTITVDAILTKRGREKLAAGNFNITKFALADDEVDYTLWDENHGKGTNFYGQAIENMPMVEAVPDESKVMRFKLMTLEKNIQKLPFLQLSPANAIFAITHNGDGTINAKTSIAGGGSAFADTFYSAIISDGTLVSFRGDDINLQEGGSISKNFFVVNGSADINIFGMNLSTTTDKTTTLTVIGNATGITQTVTISVAKDPG